MSTTLPPTPAAQTLARQAMAQMSKAGYSQARRIGDECLTSIESQGNAVESSLASASQVAARRTSLDPKVALAAEAAALRAIADGVQVSASQAIAQCGNTACGLAETYDDTQSRALGVDYLYQYVQAAQSPAEKAAGQAALDASRQTLTDKNAALAQIAGLQVLAGGVAAPGTAIATIALNATNRADRWDDARNLGYIYLQSLADNGDNDRQKTIARTALTASSGYMSPDNATNIQLHAYQDILNG